ncbi:Abi-alpha family protein [Nocardioides sp. C4-1]|uniref:Abi-alpha family protein n=1 Tax=Nocardioides sp. C4-1 TaxID=3151851 RepID=UPI003266C063
MSTDDERRRRDARHPRDLQRLPELLPAAESLPGIARVAASAAWHTAGWGARTSAKAWLRVGRAATSQEEAAALARDAGHAIAVVGELARTVSAGTPVGRALMSAGADLGGLVPASSSSSAAGETVDGEVVAGRLWETSAPEPPSLRDLGHELLSRSRDVWSTDQGHPAYERILSEMAPDEARILVLLLNKGPQPSVDVRTGGPIGMVSSQLIAPGLTMIGPRAGCRYVDQVPAYLNNLFRLGLVWFSREALRDPMEYQVVEAQPDVLAAMHSVKFAKVVRRSIHLTPFGEDFCRTCLVEEDAADAAFPEHGTPGDGESVGPGH